MKHHSGRCDEMYMAALCLHAFFNFEGGLLDLETGLISITAQQKYSWGSKFPFCSFIQLFCTPSVFMEAAKFIQGTKASSKHGGGENFLS